MFLASAAVADLDNLDSLAAEDAAEAESPGWFRQIRTGLWTANGADPDALAQTLRRIENGGHPRWNPDLADTLTAFGPGHWRYEFERLAQATQAGAEVAVQSGETARARDLFRAASTYFVIAGFPHFREQGEVRDLTAARRNYAQAMRLSSIPYEEVALGMDGYRFTASLHMPATAGPWPVLMQSGGIDETALEFSYNVLPFTAKGVALVTFDIPGTANAGRLDADLDRHHLRVLRWLREDPRFDGTRIALWSNSMGGNAVAKVAIRHPHGLRAAVNSCGLIHDALVWDPAAPRLPERLAELLPTMAAQVYIDRLGLEAPVAAPALDYPEFARRSSALSLLVQGVVGEGVRTKVPILSVNTHDDPLVPVADSLAVAHASRSGEIWFAGESGHCPPPEVIPRVTRWVLAHLLAEDSQ